ncbi:unnamed protein product [Phyllotreta striolata]|uniref:dihydrofolate reductase n=1 Tax=Phyllotreta striolata TaxID=444603 RepID=A0A9N9T9Z0_PHYSR|nr:unnamed protein product [Phyllotreta striolata]
MVKIRFLLNFGLFNLTFIYFIHSFLCTFTPIESTMPVKLNLIAAACENMGIGKNNNLPWKLKSEMDYFTKMTSKTSDPNKKNVVIMGRRTWESIPKKYKPLADRINFVLSRSDLDLNDYTNTFHFNSLESCIEKLEVDSFKNVYETVWIIGGSHLYEEAMRSNNFYRLYLTRILKTFDCDTFFPPLPAHLKKVSDPEVPDDIQSEKGINFTYNIYEKTV